MRQIKFRIWDSTNNIMITENNYQEIIDKYMNTSADYMQNEWCPVCSIDIPFWINDLEKDKILLQWTGLKDKNGVDIYEGNILKGDNTNFIVKWNNHRMGFSLYPTKEMIYDDMPINVENKIAFEVIGNIYENKELLGDK